MTYQIPSDSEGFFGEKPFYLDGVLITEEPTKRGKGRPATGRTTRTVRIPKDMDLGKAMEMYYDWLPVIEEYRDTVAESPDSVRNEKLVKLLQELGIL